VVLECSVVRDAIHELVICILGKLPVGSKFSENQHWITIFNDLNKLGRIYASDLNYM
jgi:hypothetical protein